MFRSGRPASHLQEGRREDRRCVLHFLRPEIGVFSATLGPGRSYCPVGSDASTESDQNGLWIAALTHTRHPYRGCSLCHLPYLGFVWSLPGPPSVTYLQEFYQFVVDSLPGRGLTSTSRAKTTSATRSTSRGHRRISATRSTSRVLTARDTARAHKQVGGSSGSTRVRWVELVDLRRLVHGEVLTCRKK